MNKFAHQSGTYRISSKFHLYGNHFGASLGNSQLEPDMVENLICEGDNSTGNFSKRLPCFINSKLHLFD